MSLLMDPSRGQWIEPRAVPGGKDFGRYCLRVLYRHVLCLDSGLRCSCTCSHHIQGQIACLRARWVCDSSHDALEPCRTRKLFFLHEVLQRNKTPVPDRATPQRPYKKPHIERKQPRTAEPSKFAFDQSSKSKCATVSKILVLRAPTTRHLGAPVPRPGTRICRYPLPQSGTAIRGLVEMSMRSHRSKDLC